MVGVVGSGGGVSRLAEVVVGAEAGGGYVAGEGMLCDALGVA